MQEIITKNPEETITFAVDFAKKLKGGEVLALEGDLGSGKTTFTKGLAEGFGVSDTINSPTFVLLKVYDILRPYRHFRSGGKKVQCLVHIDAYRVENIEDIKSVGIEDYFDRDDVILVIEWADKISEILPQNTIHIKFETVGEKDRKILLNSLERK